MPASASASAIAFRVAWRMVVLAPWPRTSRWLACAGRISRPETSPFSAWRGTSAPSPSSSRLLLRSVIRVAGTAVDHQAHAVEPLRARGPEPFLELGRVLAGEEGHQQVSRLRTAEDGEQGPDNPCADPAALPFGVDHNVLQVGEGRPVAEHHPGADDTLVPDGDHAESGSGEGPLS